MCRMFAYAGSSRAELNRLHQSLLRSAKFDPIRKRFDSVNPQHKDGWGYVIFDGERLCHYRSGDPIFADKHIIPHLGSNIFALFHARLASEDSPKHGAIFSHPFFMASDSKLIYICQNGKVRNALLPKDFPANKMSTEYTLELITTNGVNTGIKKMIGLGQSNTNVLILEIDRKTMKPSIYCLNRYIKTKDSSKNEYYKLYQKKMPHGNAIFSSALVSDIGGSSLPYLKLINLNE